MKAYYNEFEPYAASWLNNLIDAGEIAPGTVDTRSILDVSPTDLAGYDRCHFFAGIAGWDYALRLQTNLATDVKMLGLPSAPGSTLIISPLVHKTFARVGRLRCYGNAIVAPLAAIFIKTVMEILQVR